MNFTLSNCLPGLKDIADHIDPRLAEVIAQVERTPQANLAKAIRGHLETSQ